MEFGHVKFIKPQAPELIPWVKGYYIHVDLTPDFESRVTFYQNITTTISIYRNSRTSGEGRLRRQHYEEGAGFSAVLAGLVDKYQ